MSLYIILGAVVVLALWSVTLYNRFVALINNSKEAWADIDTQLKRRYDLIPNLVETVKGYASHERETFDAVTEARTKATAIQIDPTKVTPEQIQAFEGADHGLTSALGKLLAVAENYPDLKSNTNFIELQRELSDTENKIQAARRFYNSNVRDLRTALQQFPGNIIGNIFHFQAMEFFELGEGDGAAKEPVKVEF
jgi:LemA protein